MVVRFHLSEDEDERCGDICMLPKKINLYGSYGEVKILQIKSVGAVREMAAEEKAGFLDLVKKRFVGEKIGDDLPVSPDPREIKEALELLTARGYFYCFTPTEYWCDTSEG